MITLYELLEVDEKATKEEIEESYQKLLMEYKIDPILSADENKENEMILNKLKMAFDILDDEEKRKKYDRNLSKKRAEDLLKKLPDSKADDSTQAKEDLTEKEENVKSPKLKNNIGSNDDSSFYDNDEFDDFDQKDAEEYVQNVELSKEEKNKVKKAAQREFKENLRKAQMVEEEYQKEYNKAYNDYLKKMGMKTNEPVTLKKIKNRIIVIFSIIIVCFIAWKIPPIQRKLIGIYNDNFIIKSLVDIFKIILNSIFGLFKK